MEGLGACVLGDRMEMGLDKSDNHIQKRSFYKEKKDPKKIR